ncbi:MAG: alpha/beta hydrolase [Calothrix sp. SM1_5_4]|nr:alpha/beta hydrolase [Calothrix sp. SM1_5_4]
MKNERPVSTWILLRGLVREKGHWGPFLDQFSQAFASEEVLAIDLPGMGEFRDRRSPANMKDIFQFVRGQAIARGRAQSRFRLVAISLGAMVAVEWMRQKPEDLSGCVLINTSLRTVSPFYHRLRWQVWGDFLKILSIQSPREREKAIVDLLINSEEARAKALAIWTKIAIERPVSYRDFAAQLFAAARFDPEFTKSEIPVLLLSGLGDRMVEPSCSTALHERWGWPIERHPWAGHDLPWDDPDWVVRKIQSWAARLRD